MAWWTSRKATCLTKVSQTSEGEDNLSGLGEGVYSSDFQAVGEVKNFKVSICERKRVEAFIERWHYSKNVNGLMSDYCFKLQDEAGNLIGAMMYGSMAMAFRNVPVSRKIRASRSRRPLRLWSNAVVVRTNML